MYTIIVWFWLLSAIGLIYKGLYSSFYFIQNKYTQHINKKAKELQCELNRQEQENKVKNVLYELTKDEISLLKYVLDKSGVIWLPDRNAQVLGLVAAGLIKMFTQYMDIACYRGDECRILCSAYVLTSFTKENKVLLNKYLIELYKNIEIAERFSEYQIDDNFTLP